MARSGSRRIAAGAPKAILQKMRNERVPVLRISGHRPAPKQEGHSGTALLLDASADNTNELRQRLFMGKPQGRCGRVDGQVLRRLPLSRQLGYTHPEAAAG